MDTNVLVNSRILEAPEHDIARASLQRAFQDREPEVSRHVSTCLSSPGRDLAHRHDARGRAR